jgi:regulation of enolase protein 1 (concanavalin A-like superfamily)
MIRSASIRPRFAHQTTPAAAVAFGLGAALLAACQGPIDPQDTLDNDLSTSSEALTVPGTWSQADVGAVAAAGSFTQAWQTITVKGSGADLYGAADEFHFVYKPISGDVIVTAQVTQLDLTDANAKAFVMIRETTKTGSKYVASELTPTSSNMFRVQARTATGGTSTLTKATTASAIPAWLRVVRLGTKFQAYFSTDGATWKTIGSAITVSMTTTALVGIGTTSHKDGVLTTAGFYQTTIEAPCTAGAHRCDGVNEQICSTGRYWQAYKTCSSACGSQTCGASCVSIAPNYCIDNQTGDSPSSLSLCEISAVGNVCSADPSGLSCDSATQTYRYVYARRASDGLYLLNSSTYWVCDWNSSTPVADRVWHTGG